MPILGTPAGQQAIFFGVNRDHSRRVVERLNAEGVKAAHVDGDDHAARRDRIMAEFRDGAIQVVGNCDLISEGFDAPGCSVIMMGSPTLSITRYLQQAGRAMRPGLGKRALILDLSGISHELGLPDEPREWTLEDGEVSERRKDKAKPRECPQCHTMFYGRRCPECAYQSPLVEVEETRTDLVEATGRPEPNGKRPNRRSDLWAELRDRKAQLRRARRGRGHSQTQGIQARLGRAYLGSMGEVMKEGRDDSDIDLLRLCPDLGKSEYNRRYLYLCDISRKTRQTWYSELKSSRRNWLCRQKVVAHDRGSGPTGACSRSA